MFSFKHAEMGRYPGSPTSPNRTGHFDILGGLSYWVSRYSVNQLNELKQIQSHPRVPVQILYISLYFHVSRHVSLGFCFSSSIVL